MKILNLDTIRIFFFCILISITGCEKDPDPTTPEPGPTVKESIIDGEVTVTINPSRVAPLAARIEFSTKSEAAVQVRVIGKNGPASDIAKLHSELTTDFSLIVLGLYASYDNEVELSFLDAGGEGINKDTVNITTGILLSDLPRIQVEVADMNGMVSGLTLVNYFGHNGQSFPQRPFMFDAWGDIRWYLNFAGSGLLSNLFFDAGMIRLQNGNLCFGDISGTSVYEIDILGNIQNKWSLEGNRFHHAVHEKPNGNILATLTNPRLSTVEDLIVEFDRNSDRIINSWDLTKSLDQFRRTWDTELADTNRDWIHCNGVIYDPSDNTIVVSGRTQGIVKLNEDNEIVWIIAPHKGWETAGNGKDLNQYLLQPIDAQGVAIEDQDVIVGNTNHPDFEWNWYQHSPSILPNGNFMVFDNGDNRNYKFTGFNDPNAYSRAVEFNVDATDMTVQQVYSYGKQRGGSTFSKIVSRADYLEEKDNVIFAPGSLRDGRGPFGKVIEVDKTSGDVVFEASILPPRANFGITFHSVYRMTLYTD